MTAKQFSDEEITKQIEYLTFECLGTEMAAEMLEQLQARVKELEEISTAYSAMNTERKHYKARVKELEVECERLLNDWKEGSNNTAAKIQTLERERDVARKEAGHWRMAYFASHINNNLLDRLGVKTYQEFKATELFPWESSEVK